MVDADQYDQNLDDGVGTTYSYDEVGRLIEIRNALGVLVERNRYTLLGKIERKEDSIGLLAKYNYDIRGLVENVSTGGRESEGEYSQSYTYDVAGHITGICDGEGNETRYELDEWGRITAIHKPDKTTEQFTYDYAGNIEKATDGNGNTITYQYNSFNQLKEIIDQTGERETFTYDKHGRRSRHNRKNGTYARYEYNVDNRLVRKSGYTCNPNNKNNGKAIETPQLEDNYIYNKEGQLIQAIGGGIVYFYDYTPSGRVKSKKLNNPKLNNQRVLQYVYTKSGKVSRLKDQTGKETCYEYDVVGRAVRITDGGQTLAEYSYMEDNSLQSVKFANGITTNYTYDENRNYASLVIKTKKGEEILSYQYQYNRNGNRTKIESLMRRSGQPEAVEIPHPGLMQTERNTSPNLSALAGETRYTYDAMQRLSSVQYPNAAIEEYAYDNAGNRVLKRCGDLETRYSYNNRNQLLYSNVYDTEKPYRETSYTYDLQGNLVNETMTGLLSEQKTIPVEEKLYEYDTLNRTSSVQIQRGEEQSTQKNFYDAEGLRCGVEENGETTNFLTNGWSIVAELDKEYNVRRRLVRGYGIVASEESSLNESGRYRFYHTNEHTDIVMLTNTEGNVINQYEYDAFGNYRSIREQEKNRYGYTGEVYDNLTEQYYLRARYYNPTIARFTQEDEYRGDGLNLYAYCGNNPVMYADPSGYKKGSGCGGTGVDSEQYNRNRTEAINDAKERAGIPKSQQPTRQWTVGDDIYKKGGSYSNYEFSDNPTHHGRYYEYDTPYGKKVIVDHTNDIDQGLHTHAGEPPRDAINKNDYDFKNPDFSYYPVDGTHHIHYN